MLPKYDDINPSSLVVINGNSVSLDIYSASLLFPHPGGPKNINVLGKFIPLLII